MAHEVAVIGGIVLRTLGNDIIVEVELGGDYIEVIREHADIRETAISHHIEGREIQRRIDKVFPLPAALADAEAVVDRMLGPLIEPRPFDPVEFGFVQTFDRYTGTTECWERGNYILWRGKSSSQCGIDQMSPAHNLCRLRMIYLGAWPNSAASARIILEHLGVGVE